MPLSHPPRPDPDRHEGLTLRPFRDHRELEACVRLQHATWGDDFDQAVPTAILWAAQRTGGVASGAFDETGALHGFVFGITGIQNGEPLHWSDMLAVGAAWRGRGLGLALKRHQRSVLLGRGVSRAYWTFEPLEARNGHVNFHRLGAVSREYLRDVYGETGSELHAGIGTDRLVVEWRLDSERVAARLDGRAPAPAADGGPVVNAPAAAGAGPASPADAAEPAGRAAHAHPAAPMDPRLDLDVERVRIAVPLDIQSLKRERPEQALRWRAVTRAAFEHYLGRGFVVTDARRGGRILLYQLEREPELR